VYNVPCDSLLLVVESSGSLIATMKKKILFIYPRFNDYASIPRLSLNKRYDIFFGKYRVLDTIHQRGISNSDDIDDYRWSDIEAILDAEGNYDAVISTCDYPGSLFSPLYAEKWGYIAPSVESVLASQHKYLMRKLSQDALPEATAQFHYIDPSNPLDLQKHFPLFFKAH